MIFKMRLPGIEPSNDREQRHGSQEASNLRRRSLQLQAQIAETLGLPVTAFHQADTIRPSGPDALESTQGEAFAMSQDCSALFAAFTSIADPQERQRLLQIVRDAAGRPAKVPVKT